METVKVEKSGLLAIIRDNRSAHRAAFEKALTGFRAEAMNRLEGMLERLRKGKTVNMAIHLPVPQDHTPDYDRAVRMLELDVEDHVILTQREFAQYVQDDWGWKQDFLTTCSGYSA